MATSPTDEASEELQVILTGLSDDHRKMLLLRFIDDLSQPEIAERLDIPLGTGKSRLHHAIRIIKESPTIQRLLPE